MSQSAELQAGLATPPATQRGEGWTRQSLRWLRPLLMAGGVAVLAACALALWLNGGRVVSIDDAAIGAARVAVATDVAGIVTKVAVHEGQFVRAGDVLFRLDDRPFRIAVEGAEAELAQTRLDIEAMKRDYHRMLHETEAREAQVQADENSFGRFASLVQGGAVTRAETDDAKFKLAADRRAAAASQSMAEAQLARIGWNSEIDPERMPAYQRAKARLDELRRQLDHTVIRAPFDGIATEVDGAQPGMFLAAASPAFMLVSTTDVWATANPKETELTWVKPGSPASITVDTYPGVTFHGTVESIAPASGSEFSVLPAQNTSGNWVKVVQRIPLRIRIDKQPDAPPLRAGMSVNVAVDTGHDRSLHDLF